MLPRPTAAPVAAKIKVQREDHWPWMDCRSEVIVLVGVMPVRGRSVAPGLGWFQGFFLKLIGGKVE